MERRMCRNRTNAHLLKGICEIACCMVESLWEIAQERKLLFVPQWTAK